MGGKHGMPFGRSEDCARWGSLAHPNLQARLQAPTDLIFSRVSSADSFLGISSFAFFRGFCGEEGFKGIQIFPAFCGFRMAIFLIFSWGFSHA
jgi:hypothetical protein